MGEVRTSLRAGVAAGLGFAVCLGSLPVGALAQSVAAPAGAAVPAVAAQAPKLTAKQRRKNEEDAEDAYVAGAKLLERRDVEGAEREFVRAAKLNPENRDYLRAAVAMRESRVTELVQKAGKARIMGKDREAEGLLVQARAIDPDNDLLKQHPVPESWKTGGRFDVGGQERTWVTDGPRLAGAVELTPTAGVKSFHIHAQEADVMRQVAAAYGIQASFDESIKPVMVRFDLEDVTYAQAMHVATQMAGAFAVPIDATRVMVAKDTPEKRASLEHLEQETIYLPGMANTQVTDVGNMIRNVFEVKQMNVSTAFDTIVVRAPAETIRVLNLTLADLMDGGSQILFDLKLYTIDKSVTRNLGVTVPNQVGAYSVDSAANSLVSANQSIVNEAVSEGLIPSGASNLEIAAALIYYGLATSSLLSGTVAFLGNGISATGLYSSDLEGQLNLALSSSDTRALDDIQLRVGDRESAVFRAGERYPITQSTYTTSGTTTGTTLAGATIGGVSIASLLSAATTETIPQIQYEDLGITLKATPTLGRFGQISLHLDLKIESLEGTSIDNIPILNNTAFTSDITVQDGSTATLVSNLTRSQSAAVTGIPGLSDLPGFQSSPDLLKTTDESQLVMVLTPHIVRKRREETAGPQIPMAVPAMVE